MFFYSNQALLFEYCGVQDDPWSIELNEHILVCVMLQRHDRQGSRQRRLDKVEDVLCDLLVGGFFWWSVGNGSFRCCRFTSLLIVREHGVDTSNSPHQHYRKVQQPDVRMTFLDP